MKKARDASEEARSALHRKAMRRATKALSRSRLLLPGGSWLGLERAPQGDAPAAGHVPLLPTVKDEALGLIFRRSPRAHADVPIPVPVPIFADGAGASRDGAAPSDSEPGVIWVRIGGPWVVGLPPHAAVVGVRRIRKKMKIAAGIGIPGSVYDECDGKGRIAQQQSSSADAREKDPYEDEENEEEEGEEEEAGRLLLVVGPGARNLLMATALVTPLANASAPRMLKRENGAAHGPFLYAVAEPRISSAAPSS